MFINAALYVPMFINAALYVHMFINAALYVHMFINAALYALDLHVFEESLQTLSFFLPPLSHHRNHPVTVTKQH